MRMRLVAIQTLLILEWYDSEGNDYDKGEGGEPILGELSYPNKSSAVLRVKSVECSA